MLKHTLTTTAAAAVLAGGGAVVATSAVAAPSAVDGDAELVTAKKLRLSAETRGADSVQFVYGGHSYAGRLVDVDAEDGEREWSRTVTAHDSDRSAGRVVKFKVSACDGGACTTTTVRERLEWDD
jgi:hypothetical protein